MSKIETSLSRLLAALGLLSASLIGFSGVANAQGCNVVNVETVIPPDNFGHSVYISLVSEEGSVTTSCKASFPYPASGETDTIEEKCAELEDAVATQCGPQYGTVDDCAANATFQAFDVNFLATLSLGISNDPTIFSQTGNGQAIPDYEGDRITNSCGGEGFGSMGTFGGEATGAKLVEESASSGVIVELAVFETDTVNLPPDPPAFDRSFVSTVSSSSGDSASMLVAAAASDLASQIASDSEVADIISVNADGRSMVARTTAADIALSLVFMSNDEGITSSSVGGSLSGIQRVASSFTPIPALSGYALALYGILLLTAAWLTLRRRSA